MHKTVHELIGLAFDADEGGSGGSTSEAEDTQPEATTPAETEGVSEPTLTQDEVDKLVGKARTEGKKKALGDLLSDLGFEDTDTLANLVKSAREQEDAQKSEAEKLSDKLTALQKQLDEKEAAHQATVKQWQAEKLKSVVLGAIRDANVQSNRADDVWVLMQADGQINDLMDDDGEINDDAVSAAIKQFQQKRPEYFKPDAPGSPSNAGGKPPAPEYQLPLTPKTRL